MVAACLGEVWHDILGSRVQLCSSGAGWMRRTKLLGRTPLLMRMFGESSSTQITDTPEGVMLMRVAHTFLAQPKSCPLAMSVLVGRFQKARYSPLESAWDSEAYEEREAEQPSLPQRIFLGRRPRICCAVVWRLG